LILKNNKNCLIIILRTWRLPRGREAECVAAALRVGFRSLDCAALYNNEAEVGRCLSLFLTQGAECHTQPAPHLIHNHSVEGKEIESKNSNCEGLAEGADPIGQPSNSDKKETMGGLTKNQHRKKRRKERKLGTHTQEEVKINLKNRNEEAKQKKIENINTNISIKREDLFITSKLWNTHHRPQKVFEACTTTLQNLGLTYLDLYLMHWPVAFVPDARPPLRRNKYLREEYIDRHVTLKDTWQAMEELVKRGLVKSIGVSNFGIKQLEELLQSATLVPVVNQIEMHPYLLQPDLIRYCQEKDIKISAYSPLGQGKELLQDSVVKSIATKCNKTASQVLLRWGIQHKAIVIFKSSSEEHLRENMEALQFSLDDEDMHNLDALNKNYRYMIHWLPNSW